MSNSPCLHSSTKRARTGEYARSNPKGVDTGANWLVDAAVANGVAGIPYDGVDGVRSPSVGSGTPRDGVGTLPDAVDASDVRRTDVDVPERMYSEANGYGYGGKSGATAKGRTFGTPENSRFNLTAANRGRGSSGRRTFDGGNSKSTPGREGKRKREDSPESIDAKACEIPLTCARAMEDYVREQKRKGTPRKDIQGGLYRMVVAMSEGCEEQEEEGREESNGERYGKDGGRAGRDLINVDVARECSRGQARLPARGSRGLSFGRDVAIETAKIERKHVEAKLVKPFQDKIFTISGQHMSKETDIVNAVARAESSRESRDHALYAYQAAGRTLKEDEAKVQEERDALAALEAQSQKCIRDAKPYQWQLRCYDAQIEVLEKGVRDAPLKQVCLARYEIQNPSCVPEEKEKQWALWVDLKLGPVKDNLEYQAIIQSDAFVDAYWPNFAFEWDAKQSEEARRVMISTFLGLYR